jgi:hypothetical protein
MDRGREFQRSRRSPRPLRQASRARLDQRCATQADASVGGGGDAAGGPQERASGEQRGRDIAGALRWSERSPAIVSYVNEGRRRAVALWGGAVAGGG